MKIILTKARRKASALLTTLVICSILCTFVLFYLALIDQQNFLGARSQTWNLAIAISEAGIEDGLQHINANYPNLNCDGWVYDGTSYYSRSNSLPDGSSYVAYVYLTNFLNPVIVSRSYVQEPIQVAHLGAIGVTPQQSVVSRAVMATTSKANLFIAAVVAKQSIDLNGNNVTINSFDSGFPGVMSDYNGLYNPSFYVGSHGDVAVNQNIANSLNVGNANIYGHAHTGPGGPNALTINNGAVGDVAYQATQSGVESGWWMQDANFTIPDRLFPNTAGYFTPTGGVYVSISNNVSATPTTTALLPLPLPLGTITTNCVSGTWQQDKFTMPLPGTYCGAITTNGNKYSYFLKAGTTYTYNLLATNSYYVTNTYNYIFYGSAGATNNYVLPNALSGTSIVTGPNVNVALPNGINLSGSSDSLTVVSGADVTIYAKGSCKVAGNGMINSGGFASSLVIYCDPSVTTFDLGGNAAFTGALVAPEAKVNLNGSGNSTVNDLTGCVIANSVVFNGKYNVHYDEALSRNKANGRFLITSWNEVK
jgi:hypothetical protein